MSASEDITIPLEPDCYYHIYNRGNNSEVIFYTEENYKYFLKKFDSYMSGYFNVFCYCLLPNHFHFLIKVKSLNEILSQIKIDFLKDLAPERVDLENLKVFLNLKNPEYYISEKFRRFFLSYAKSINKQQERKGSLFQKYFRRKKINSDEYFRGLVWYIHNNPVNHKIYSDYKTYKWSSYHRILQNNHSKLIKSEVIEWFENRDNYILFHEEKKIEWGKLQNLIIENDLM